MTTMSDEVAIPSMWPARHQRREAAVARDRANVEKRFKNLEDAISSMTSKVDDILSKISQSALQYPPGLVSFQERLERLETLLVCSSQLSPDVDSVLTELLNRRSNPEPEKELSPIKEAIEKEMNNAPVLPECLFFGIYSDTEEIDEDSITISKCEEISRRINDQLRQTIAEENHCKLEEFVLDSYGGLVATVPNLPRTTLERDVIRQTYASHDRHWAWSLMTRRFHDGAGDSKSKSDLFLKVMYIIVSTLKKAVDGEK